MILNYKYRIKDRTARKALRRHAAASNQVWNWCAAQQKDAASRYRAGAKPRRWATYFELAAACNGVGRDIGLPQQTVAAICQQFALSRNRAGRPIRFRASGGSKRSLGWVPFQTQTRKVEGNSVVFARKRYRFWEGGRPVPANATSGAFVEDSQGRWYICFWVNVEGLPPAASGEIGVDLGLKTLATTSCGEVIANPRHTAKYAEKLAVAQRAGNKRRVTALHAKIKNTRRDYLHKVSAKLSREYALIVVGDVSSARLMKTRMAKSVSDAGWAELRTLLAYKASRHGGRLVIVNERFTTQTCSSCGCLPPERPKGIAGLGIRTWDCSECGVSHDRDVNAARNILRIGRSVPPPVEESRRIAA